DNDLRVRSTLERSDRAAEASMRSLWDSANPNYPPEVYGDAGRLDVEILSINSSVRFSPLSGSCFA
ncbi:VirB8/TrbF family protein, partial [Ascidiaceihabitans sp.]|uniref:VirB8/TrbF family protein n=1 Tax=Ascidiaceihabitans sp. TaxID=1872644 RepID=UPI00329A195E